MILGPVGFATPWLLVALALLPVLWVLLRAVPPAPIRRKFPGVALLLGLKDEDSVTDRTPWWLLLLRMFAVAAVIVGLAGPVLDPQDRGETRFTGPLLILMDGSWAAGRDWQQQRVLLEDMLAEAGREGRTVAMMRLSDPEAPVFQAADTWRTQLSGLDPSPWAATEEDMNTAAGLLADGNFETRWFSDGLAREGRDAVLRAVQSGGPVMIYETPRPLLALAPAALEDGALQLTVRRSVADGARDVTIEAHGRDPAGTHRLIETLSLSFEPDATEASGALSLPSELRARLTRFEIAGQNHAGAVTLSDDSLQRRDVALIAGREDREGLELLSPLHYLRQALEPSSDLMSGGLQDVLPANPDVIILADVATLSNAEKSDLLEWIDRGGTLLRFAGPRLAASDVSRATEDPLMPVRLRSGGRSVGGAMSWGEPKALAPFDEDSPFYGLAIPQDVSVSAQVVAQPDPTLSERAIAELSDGTPLVTRKRSGAGQVVLFHVTANAEWSTLPLSGLFVQMLERLSVSSTTSLPSAEDLAGTTWKPVTVLDGQGRISDAGNLPGVAGNNLISAPLGPALRPGLYDGPDRMLARNVVRADTVLEPVSWPADVPVTGLDRADERPLAGWLLGLALVLLSADVLASLALSGRLAPARATLVLALLLAMPQAATAQDEKTKAATSEVVLAYVITGDRRIDETSRAGLAGLSETLFFRTSVEPADPIGVDLEMDELAVYPLLYWPITPDQPQPSAEAYGKLNTYLRTGGMIMFDTRDANVAGFGASSPNGAKLQRLAAPLDIPPLEPLPDDHVLTRTFYLLQDFPGRHAGRSIWVEAAPPDVEQVEGMPFRNLNDGVTPVVIGGNDWAAAWAMDERGNPLYPVGRGYSGERQRELAYRFGVNLVMHVLTGNYKSDQVHVPALLNRLGQ